MVSVTWRAAAVPRVAEMVARTGFSSFRSEVATLTTADVFRAAIATSFCRLQADVFLSVEVGVRRISDLPSAPASRASRRHW